MNLKNTLILASLGLVSLACSTKSDTKTAENTDTKELNLLVGTYTKKGSEGIYYYKINPETGDAKQVGLGKNIVDPSFLVLSKSGEYLYAVSEEEGGSVVAYSVKDTALIQLNKASSGGVHPCHITIDQTGKWILVGNYSDGSLSVLPILADGKVGEPIQTIKHSGSGPNKDRQTSPHVHSINIAPNNIDVFVPDLGIDKVMAYRFDANTGKLVEGNSLSVKPGSGPRHMSFSPDGKFAYLIQEMGSQITSFKYTDGQLEKIQEISTLPEGFEGNNACADIHISPDGKFVYGSNRFHDTIVIFERNLATGQLQLVSHHSVMGAVPRNFSLSPDGKLLLVANQDTDNIVLFDRNESTGKISPKGKEIKVSMPVCLIWGK